jgi:hypothetical protein
MGSYKQEDLKYSFRKGEETTKGKICRVEQRGRKEYQGTQEEMAR